MVALMECNSRNTKVIAFVLKENQSDDSEMQLGKMNKKVAWNAKNFCMMQFDSMTTAESATKATFR